METSAHLEDQAEFLCLVHPADSTVRREHKGRPVLQPPGQDSGEKMQGGGGGGGGGYLVLAGYGAMVFMWQTSL